MRSSNELRTGSVPTLGDETGDRLGGAGPEVDRRLGVKNPGMSWTGGTRAPWSVPRTRGLEHDFIEFPDRVPHAGGGLREERMEVMHPRCAGLDVHKETVVA
jgi:hypothetical protein